MKRPLILAFTTLITSGAFTVFANQLQPGDILVNEFAASSVQVYSPAGALLQTFSDGGQFWEGASLTPGGKVVTTYRAPSTGVKVFNTDGSVNLNFGTAGTPANASVFADGAIAVADQTNKNIFVYSASGIFLRNINLPSAQDPDADFIGQDNTLWVTDGNAKTVFHATEGGTLLGSFSTTFLPTDLVVDGSGNLRVCSFADSNIYCFTPTGTLLSEFNTPIANTDIALANDGSLYIDSQDAATLYHYDTSGNLLGSFPLSSPNQPLFMSVVPVPVPEPAALALCGAGIITFGGSWFVQRQRKQRRHSRSGHRNGDAASIGPPVRPGS